MINNGYTIWARQTIESDIFYKKPPEWFKIWFFIVQSVNFKNTKQLKRGVGYFNWSEISLDLTGISRHQFNECIKWLKWAKQITTQKTTRGNIIFVLNYNKFQDKKNYKTEAETHTKTQAKPKQNRSRTDTITERMKECKNEKNDIYCEPSSRETFSFKNKLDLMLKNEKDKRRPIIATYWIYKKYNILEENQYQPELRRQLRPAGDLIGYSLERIKEVMFFLNSQNFKWTLESVSKYILEDLKKLENNN